MVLPSYEVPSGTIDTAIIGVTNFSSIGFEACPTGKKIYLIFCSPDQKPKAVDVMSTQLLKDENICLQV